MPAFTYLELLIQAANAGELDKPLLAVSERKEKPKAEKPLAVEDDKTPATGKAQRTTRGH